VGVLEPDREAHRLEALSALERALVALRQARKSMVQAGLQVAGHALDEVIDMVKRAVSLYRSL
jgi:exonuclease VII small subunit